MRNFGPGTKEKIFLYFTSKCLEKYVGFFENIDFFKNGAYLKLTPLFFRKMYKIAYKMRSF